MKHKLFILINLLVLCTMLAPSGRPVAQTLPAEAGVTAETTQDALSVGYVGQIGGATYAVGIQGNYAYIGVGPRLVVLDISIPASPLMVGKTQPFPDLVMGVTVSGNYAYMANYYEGLRVVDITNPAHPIEVGSCYTPDRAFSVAVLGNYAYVASGSAGLRVVNIADPTNPAEVGFYDTPEWSLDVAILGEYAYVASYYDGLRVVNISDPTNPVEVSFYDPAGEVEGVAIMGDYAYVANRHYGLQVVNIADPANPVEVSGGDLYLGHAMDVAVVGDYAYLADYDYGLLRVMNITDPASPIEVGVYTIWYAYCVAVVGDYAYVADSRSGLVVVNIADPTNPAEVGYYGSMGDVYSVAVSGDYAYVVDSWRLRVVDVTDPALPVEVGIINSPSDAYDVAVMGNFAYVAIYTGLQVVNIADPALPVEIGIYDTSGKTVGVAILGDYAYLANYSYDLQVLNITDPAHPVEVGVLSVPGNTYDVEVAGDYAYVATSYGLQVVNIADPVHPAEVGFYDSPGVAKGVAISGGYAYVADSGSGLRVVNITDPAHPVEVGNYFTTGLALGVTVSGSFAYVACYDYGLQVVDISDPTHPTMVGFYDTPGFSRGVTVSGAHIYVADRQGGLYILRHPITPWLLMYYLAGDNDLSNFVEDYTDILKSVNNPNIHIAIFADTKEGQAKYIGIGSGEISTVQIGEVNTGDPQTLVNFVRWANNNYPAEKTALTIFDHGNALSGVASDWTSDENELTPPEIKTALSLTGKVNVFHASACLMGNLEMEYQIRGLVDYYIGHENIAQDADIFSTLPLISSQTSPEELAISIADSYYRDLSRLIGVPSHVSVVDMSKIDNVTSKVSSLADAIKANWLHALSIWQMTDASILQRFDSNPQLYIIDNSDVLVDLYHFARLVSYVDGLETAANELMNAIDEYVIYNRAWSGGFTLNNVTYFYNLYNSYGVSIGFPRSRISYYVGDWFDFAEGAEWFVLTDEEIIYNSATETELKWGGLISDFVLELNPEEPDSPNPPPLVSMLSPNYFSYMPIIVRINTKVP